MPRKMSYKTMRRFDGGVVTLPSTGATILEREGLEIGREAPNMLRDAQNIRTRGGGIQGRLGQVEYCDFSATVMSGADVGPMFEYRREYDNLGVSDFFYAILFSTGGQYYYVEVDDNPDVLVTMSPVLNSGDFYAVNCFDYLFVATGKDPVKLFDGQSTFINCGIDKPAIPTLGVNQAGTKSRRYKYTYGNQRDPQNIESAASPVAQADNASDVNPPGVSIGITYTQAVDSQITHYYIYATEFYDITTTPPEDYYLIATKTLAQAIIDLFTFTDIHTNAQLTLSTPYDTAPRDIPPQFKYMLWHNGVMYGAGTDDDPSVLYYSVALKPFYYDTVNYWDGISRDDGDDITGLGAIGNTRYIFKGHSIWESTGDPTLAPITAVERPDASMNMTRLGIGCVDPRSLCAWVNSLIFRADDGHVYMLTQSEIIQLSQWVPAWMNNLEDGSVAMVFNDYYIIKQGSYCYVCDLKRREYGWQCRDYPIAANYFLIDHNGYPLGGENDTIVRYYTTALDKGVAIDQMWRYAFLDLAGGDQEALCREFIQELVEQGSEHTITVWNEEGTVLNSGAYASTDRAFYIGGGRAHYMSVRVEATGRNRVLQASYGYQLSRRHLPGVSY